MKVNQRTQYRLKVEAKMHLAVLDVLNECPLYPSEVVSCFNAMIESELRHMRRRLPKTPPEGHR